MSEEKPTSDGKRDAGGKFGKGNNVRSTAPKVRAKLVSQRLRKEYVRRYASMPAGADGEVLGPERALLRHYFVAMDIMDDATQEAKDRQRALEFLADRMDGKSVQSIELTGSGGGPVQTETVGDETLLTPTQRLVAALKSLGILAAHGGLTAAGDAGAVGGESPGGDAGVTGDGGSGEQAP